MKRKILFFILSSVSFMCNAQIDKTNYVIEYGLYFRHQERGNKDAMYELTYSDGRFTYCTDEYNDLTGRYCLTGHFNIEGDSIFFYDITISMPILKELTRLSPNDLENEYYEENSVYTERRRPTSSNFWSLKTNEIKKIKLDPQKRFSATFFRHKNDEYIEIDGERFYMEPGPED